MSDSGVIIEQKIRGMLSRDDTGRGPRSRCQDAVPISRFKQTWTEWELDLVDWGFVYGMAFALAREENPWEETEIVAERAIELARQSYSRWGGVPCSAKRPKVLIQFSETDDHEEASA